MPSFFFLGVDIGLDQFLHLLAALLLFNALGHGVVGFLHGLEGIAFGFLDFIVDGPEDLRLAFGEVDLFGQEGDLLGPDAFAPAVVSAPARSLGTLGEGAHGQDHKGAQHTKNLLHN